MAVERMATTSHFPLGTWKQVGGARLNLSRGVKRSSETFEDRLSHMVRFFAVNQLNVQIRAKSITECPAKFFHQDDVEIAHKHRGRFSLVDQVRPSTHVDYDARQRLVHRQKEKPVTLNPNFVAQGFFERLAQDQADILHGVVIINIRVALGLDRQIEQPMLRKQGEHMIEERHSRLDLRHTAAIDRQSEHNVRLCSLARDSRYTLGVS